MSDNGNEQAAQIKPPPQVIAQIGIDPGSGVLTLQVSGIVSDPLAFGVSALGLMAQFVQEQYLKARKPIIEVPKLVLPPESKRGAR